MKFFVAFTALAAVVSAHPFEAIFGRDTCENPNRIVTFVIDNSASNGYTKEHIKGSDPDGLRFDGARKLIAAMTPGKDQASVVTFTTSSKVLVGNTDVGNIHFNNPDIGGLTTLTSGVEGGAKQLHAAGNLRDRSALVFYSDGRDSDSILRPKLVPAALQALVNEGVRVHWAQLNVGGKEKQPPGVAQVAFQSGGIYAEVTDIASLTKFVDQVIGKGITNGDCHNNGGNPGGPIDEGVITHGICSNNVKAVYTYTAQRKVKVDIDLALLTTKNKVNLNVVLENKATGEKQEGNVNSGNAKQTISVSADKGQQVTVTVSPSNASNDECEYTVSLRTTTDNGPEPTTSSSSSTQPEPTSSSKEPEPTSSSKEPEPTSSSQSSSAGPEPTSSSQSSSVGPEPTSSQSSSAGPEPTSSSQSSSAGPEPTSSSQSSSAGPEPTSSASSSAGPEPTSSSCPAPPEPSTQTVTSTVVTTVTAPAPSATASVCICKCDTPGAKPLPKFEL